MPKKPKKKAQKKSKRKNSKKKKPPQGKSSQKKNKGIAVGPSSEGLSRNTIYPYIRALPDILGKYVKRLGENRTVALAKPAAAVGVIETITRILKDAKPDPGPALTRTEAIHIITKATTAEHQKTKQDLDDLQEQTDLLCRLCGLAAAAPAPEAITEQLRRAAEHIPLNRPDVQALTAEHVAAASTEAP